MNLSEKYGERCWDFCETKPRTFVQIQNHLKIGSSMTQLAINWCKAEHDNDFNPFLMVYNGYDYLYAPRSAFREVRLNLRRELRYLHTRLTTNVLKCEHALSTKATLSKDLGKADRRDLRLWSAQMSGAVAATEQILSRVEGSGLDDE